MIKHILALLLALLAPFSALAGVIDLREEQVEPQGVGTINDNFRRVENNKLDSRPGSIIPRQPSIYDLGSAEYPFRNLYFSGAIVAESDEGLGNRLINADFSINQRSTTTVNNDTYHLDRWYALVQASSVTVAQQTLQEAGQPTNLRLTQPSASAKRVGTAQIIESINVQDIRSAEIVLSARIRCSSAQAIRYAIIETTTTADSMTSDIVRDWTSASYTAGGFFLSTTVVTGTGSTTPLAATWTAISLTGTLTANANNIIVMFWTEGTAAQSVTLDLGVVQLEVGDEATAFERRLFRAELPLCMRYYQKSYEPTVLPGTVTKAGDTVTRRTISNEATTFFNVRFPVDMRIAPTVVWYNPTTGAADSIRNDSAASNMTVTGTDSQDPTTTKRPGAPTHAANGLVSNIILGQWTADAEL